MKKNNILFWIPLILILPVMAVLFLHFFPKVSTSTQIFNDIIIENVARQGFHKTGELQLFWGILVLGLIFLVLFQFGATKLHAKFFPKNDDSFARVNKRSATLKKLRYVVILLLPNLCHYAIYQEYSLTLLLLTLAYTISSIFCPRYAKEILAFYFLLYYAIMGILSILVQFTIHFRCANKYLWFVVATIFIFFLYSCKKLDYLKPIILWIQLPILGLFAVYFVKKYLYQGEMLTLHYAIGYYVFFILLILCLLADMLYHLWRYHQKVFRMQIEELIYVSTAITIFIYNSFSACPMFAQPDQHHHGEQMIPWQQTILLGQSLYEEYTPVSGLFPYVIGAIQHLLLGGTATDYAPAVSIMMVIFAGVTMYLIYQHVSGFWALLFAVFFSLPSYNRQYMILPVLLLLMLPKLIAKKREWLLTWIVTCFLAGLYYPLYGAAILIGTLPFGLIQLRDWWKGEKEWKSPLAFAEVLFVSLSLIANIPLLLKILNHTLTYSSQTILADGINLYGQAVPNFFLPYLQEHAYLRSCLYFSLRFLLPAIGVWCIAYVLYYFLFVYKRTTVSLSKKCHSQLFLGLTAGIGILCVSYTYTLVRADTDVILSRTSYILCAVFGMLFPIVLLVAQLHTKQTGMIFLLAISFSMPMILYQNIADTKFPDMWVYPNGESDLYLDDRAKLYSYYEVPDTFLKAEDTGLADTATLGPGFIVSDQLDYINHYASVIDKCNQVQPETYYMGLDGQGFYYYNNVKACSTGFIQAGKGYEAQQKIIALAEKERPVIFLLEPDCSYYVYYWMHNSDYVYAPSDDCFYPAELFAAIYPQEAPPDYRAYAASTDFGLVADSFGASFASLEPLLTNQQPLTDTPVNGMDYDMLYLKLDTTALIETSHKQGLTAPASLTIRFSAGDGTAYDGASISCLIGDGTLFLPMGMNPCWLLTKDLTDISIQFDNGLDSQTTALSDCITESTLYKLRQ